MEDTKKRVRDNSELDSDLYESKRHRADSVNDSSELGRVDSVTGHLERVDSGIPEISSPEEIEITDDILEILDEPDNDPTIQDLESVIKSLQAEIQNPEPCTDSGELVYLLGASDDELGLPPAISPSEGDIETKSSDLVTNTYHGVEIEENFAFVDELPSYDSYEFGIGGENNNFNDSDFVTLGGGLFDYSEAPDYAWQPESLSAL